ncbi:hypothetical protein RHS01_09712 [Rhizoctonia solani]|uniref:Retrotransposon gag domain-containing protein n=1 Tax=Rhizoctonia solani TaxID=456999 RepID=A0A8H7LXU1_9AGAM|nr:hypothetical protein RHS01_09712 [Rhizoctonia solani]
MPGLGAMGETSLTPSQIQLGWSAPSSRTHTPAPRAVPPHVYSPMSFDQMSDRELLDMVAQNMIVLKKDSTPPPPPSGTATSINPPPTSTSSNSDLKFAKPNKFSGKKEDALNFIIACQAYIRAKGANQSHEEKILWVTSYFEGAAEDWVRPYKERKQRDFARQNYDGLKNNIKDIMLSTMFQWRCATAQQVYNKAEEIANHIESTRLSNPSVSTVCTTSTAVPTSISNPTPAQTCLNVGDNVYMIDPTTRRAKKGAITSIVRTTSGNMPNVRWNGETKDTMIPFPSLKKDKRPAAAAPVKTIIAPTLSRPQTPKAQAPWILMEEDFQTSLAMYVAGKATLRAIALPSPCLDMWLMLNGLGKA